MVIEPQAKFPDASRCTTNEGVFEDEELREIVLTERKKGALKISGFSLPVVLPVMDPATKFPDESRNTRVFGILLLEYEAVSSWVIDKTFAPSEALRTDVGAKACVPIRGRAGIKLLFIASMYAIL